MTNTPLALKAHCSTEELKRAYLRSRHPLERTRLHLLWLMSVKGGDVQVSQVAGMLGQTADWGRKIIRRYNKEGLAGLEDRRKGNGAEKILPAQEYQSLKDHLAMPPEDGGLWTGPKVALWMSRLLSKKVSDVTGWHYLQHCGYTLQIPRPRHGKAATGEEQEDCKKNSGKRLSGSKRNIPEKGSKYGRKTKRG